MKALDAQQIQFMLQREKDDKTRISSDLESATSTIHELKQQLQQVSIHLNQFESLACLLAR